MKDIENTKKEAPMIGLTGMGGGAASLMWYHKVGLIKGQLWAWGNNTYGTLMTNQPGAQKRSSPVQIGTDSNWAYLMDSGNGSEYVYVAGKDDGTLWSSGVGPLTGQNQPGFPPTSVKYSSPIQIPGEWSGSMARSGQTIVATKADGSLWMWGDNYQGQLGLNQRFPQQGKGLSSPTQVGTDTNWSTEIGGVTCTQDYTLAMKQDGTLWTWGKNDNAGMGVGQPFNYRRSSPVQVPGTTWASINAGGGGNLQVATKTDGSLWVWGNNGMGQLGLNGGPPKNSPVQLGTDTTWAGVTCGGSAAWVTKTDGTLWAWGSASNGKLGFSQPSNTDISSPKQIPGTWKTDHQSVASISVATAAIKADGTLWTWGTNEVGQLGLNQNMTSGTYNYSSPKQVGTDTNWLAVGGGSATDKNFFALRK